MWLPGDIQGLTKRLEELPLHGNRLTRTIALFVGTLSHHKIIAGNGSQPLVRGPIRLLIVPTLAIFPFPLPPCGQGSADIALEDLGQIVSTVEFILIADPR